jgi:hypothetical protein
MDIVFRPHGSYDEVYLYVSSLPRVATQELIARLPLGKLTGS